MDASLGLEVVLEAVLDERGDRGVGLHDDVSAAAPAASVRAAFGHMRLAPKRHAASAAVPGLDMYMDLIDKQRVPASLAFAQLQCRALPAFYRL